MILASSHTRLFDFGVVADLNLWVHAVIFAVLALVGLAILDPPIRCERRSRTEAPAEASPGGVADYDLFRTVLSPASGAACDGRTASGGVCGQPASQRLALSGCTHPLCTDHALKASAWLAAKRSEANARVRCPVHGTYTALSSASAGKVTVAGQS